MKDRMTFLEFLAETIRELEREKKRLKEKEQELRNKLAEVSWWNTISCLDNYYPQYTNMNGSICLSNYDSYKYTGGSLVLSRRLGPGGSL